MKLTAVVLTLNEAEHISDCVKGLLFADEVVVFDSYSTDDTVKLAQEAGARVIQRAFDNYTLQRNAAISAVSHNTDWVLFIDADERVPGELASAIRSAIHKSGYAGWRIPRHNYIFGKLTTGAGWYPDYQTRLLRIGKARYNPDRQVHEVVQLDGKLGTLEPPLIHFNYTDLAQFTAKQRTYTAFEAQTMFSHGVKPKFRNFILQPYRQFKWRFLTLKGYRDGFHGLRLCLLMAWYEFQKYWMLQGMWRNKEQTTV